MANARTLPQAVRIRAWRPSGPLHGLWRLLTSVRFALWLIGFLVLSGLLGTLIPQIPIPMRGNAAAEQTWLAFQTMRFGILTEFLYRLGLFNVFGAPWFTAGLGVLVVTVSVCTVNRFPPTWRTVTQPPERVPDSFFDRTRHRTVFEAPPESDAIERVLGRHRFRVKRFENGPTTYLFADRYPWAQLGTFVSHLSLILFLAGAVVTRLGTDQQQQLIAEGRTAGIFGLSNPNHMQLQVDKFVVKFNENGLPLDYRSYLTVMQNGQVVKQGESTVNDPMSYSGFRFHQAAYSQDGAALRIRDRTTGNVVYDETHLLDSGVPAPEVVLRGADSVTLFSGLLAPTEHITAEGRLIWGRTIVSPVSDGARIFLGLVSPDEDSGENMAGMRVPFSKRRWELIVVAATATDVTVLQVLRPGETADLGGAVLEFRQAQQIPSLQVESLPGISGGAVLEMDRQNPEAASLTIVRDSGPPIELRTGGEPVVVGDMEYSFDGQRSFTGIIVRRDPGSGLIWVATALLIVGLGMTFYVPRRRLWIKLTKGRIIFAGMAGIMANFPREMQRLAAEAGSPDAEAALRQPDGRGEGQA